MALEISDLDAFLGTLAAGLPEEPRHYELRAHPDVILALRMAPPPPGYPPGAVRPRYGTASVTADASLGSGGWELRENGAVVRRGNLGEAGDAER